MQMNEYNMQIEMYKQVLASDKTNIDRDCIEAEIRALKPFAERTEQEIIKMFDTGAFNKVLKAYCRKAMKNCNVDSETISNVMNEIKWLLDTVSANEIIEQ